MDLQTVDVRFVLTIMFFCICQVGTTYVHRYVGPFGPKMCEQVCKSLEQCDSPVFDEEYLTCDLWNPNTTLADQKCFQIIESRTKGLVTVDVNETCGQVTANLNVSEVTELLRRTTEGYTESELVQRNHGINLHQACDEGRLDVVKYILSQGVEDINSRGKRGRTPVMVAVSCGQLDMFNYLVKHGCDLSLLDRTKYNILHIACMGGYLNIVKRVVSLNVIDIDSKNKYGNTSVMIAALYDYISIVKLLVSKHCNMTAVNANSDTILHLLCRWKPYNMVKRIAMLKYILSLNVIYIESKGEYEWTPVMGAVSENQRQIVSFLVFKHCSLKAVDYYGRTLLHLACEYGHGDMGKYLLSQGVFTGREKNKLGQTPAQVAPEK